MSKAVAMALQAGMIIKSTEALNGTYFEATTIVITSADTAGAVGFVVNKPFHRKLNDLEEFKYIAAFPLYEGGPVDQEHLFFIHRRPDLVEGGAHITGDIYFGGNFKQAIRCIQENLITTKDIKILIGYCGWDNAELEEEINEGSWYISPDTADIFT